MKQILLILGGLTLVSVCCWAFAGTMGDDFELPGKNITFHEVHLVCGAAPDIGCGSRSKPILLDLEREALIKEAWLNRPGTVVAVVWEQDTEPDTKAVAAIFEAHGKSIHTLHGETHDAQLASFRTDKWYQGVEVDALSMEEAGRIATRIMGGLDDLGLSTADGARMQSEIEAYIQQEFMALRDVSLLSSSEYFDRWEAEIFQIGLRYVDEDKMPKIELWGPSATKKIEKACCTKGKKGCCSKKIN